MSGLLTDDRLATITRLLLAGDASHAERIALLSHVATQHAEITALRYRVECANDRDR